MASIYIATAYFWKSRAQMLAVWLESKGHVVTSRWHRLGEEKKEAEQEYAKIDLEDINRADLLVLWTGYRGPNSHTGGKNVEFGYALASGHRIIILGPYENVFHHLVPRVDTREELHERIGEMYADTDR